MGSLEESSLAWRSVPPQHPGNRHSGGELGIRTGGLQPSVPEPSADCMWTRFRTRDRREARDFMRMTYQSRAVRLSGDPKAFEFTVQSRSLNLIRIDVVRHTGHLDMIGASGDHILVAEVFRGEMNVSTKGGRHTMRAGDAVMTTLQEPRQISCDDLGMVVVRLDGNEFRRVAAELAAVDPATRRFRGAKASPAQVRQWSAAVRYVINGVLDNPAAAGSALAQGEGFRLLTAAALEAFPQPDFPLSAARPAAEASPPTTIRRATAFVDANSSRHITVTDIAQAAHLSRRGLEAAFHRHLNTSPVAYLRSVRLARAHQQLIDADPRSGESVAEIAARCGFQHPGRFAALYREKFGVPPSHTLSH